MSEFSDPALDELCLLAGRLHGTSQAHGEFTLRSLAEHVAEVGGLRNAGNAHWKAETMDIIIHGLLLLRSAGVGSEDAAALYQRRLGRFKEKINGALPGHTLDDGHRAR